MEFRILGPLEVVDDGAVVRLGGVKLRALLTVLLLNANEPVSAGRLALALWGEDAPHGAVNTVRVHVSRVRRALGDRHLLATTEAGYCLRVRPGELDLERFEKLLDEGRHAPADDRPARAADVLREALALWRGPPLADLEFEPFAAAEIARLEERRVTAVEARIEADLVVGRHADLVSELQRLVSGHPRRERLAGQLMLALYRCERQAEALGVYAETRRVLVAELGVEPGPELRRLHEAILRQEERLELRVMADELPAELDTATAPPLAGRHDELAWLRQRWEHAREGRGRIVTLAGVSGSGKLRLAAELAASAHASGAAAVLYATGSGPADAFRAALRHARRATRPTLLVLHAADGAGAVELAELDALSSEVKDLPVLVLACREDVDAAADRDSDGVLLLDALNASAVRAIARQYARGAAADDVPTDWLLEASGGVPRAVHELARQWARRAAARHVDAVAGRAAVGRAELRAIQAELTGGVEDLQEVGERSPPTPWEAVVCPFKGLAFFDTADAPFFFGREKLVAELVARLVGAQLLGIVGPSGSGKSSVSRAGLLPALAGGVLPGSETWKQVLIRPGEHPLRELTDAMAGIADGERAVVAVDQFEETFTTCEDEAERDAFIAELGRMAAQRDGRRIVLVVLRADFYGRCAAYPELAGPLAANHVLVRSMQRDELHRAIELPARRAGLRVDPELADALIADVKDEPGALPLLSTALLELWQRRDGRRLRYSVYEQTGGVRGAVARLAEEAFAELDEQQQVVARGVLMRLAGEGATGGVERRRVALAELEVDRNEDVARVVDLLTARRLLTASEGTIELAHEALMREWPRLRDWINADREGLRIHRNLNAAARAWEEIGRDEGALYRGARLTEAIEWSEAQQPGLNEIERAFLKASDARRLLEQRQRRRRITFALGGLSTAVLLISAVAILAVLQSREASRQRDIAASRELAASATTMLDVDPALSLALASRALDRAHTGQAESVFRQATLAARAVDAWPTHDTPARSLSISGDGLPVATAADDGTLAVRRMDTRRPQSLIEPRSASQGIIGVTLSPDGRRFVGARANGTVTISAIDGRDRRTLVDLGDTIVNRYRTSNYATVVRFAAAGRWVAVGALDGTVRVLRPDGSPRGVVLGRHDGQILDIDINRAGTRVVSASGDSVRVWAVRDGSAVTLPQRGSCASFSPDGRLIATAGEDGIVRLWAADGRGPLRQVRIGQPVVSVRFSSDGRRLVTGAQDGVVRIADRRAGRVLEAFRRHRGVAWQTDFAAGGQVVSTGDDGFLRRWHPLDPTIVLGSFRNASFSRDGRRLLTGGSDGHTRVHDMSTGATVATIGADMKATTARYSADGARIVTASLDSAVAIADVRTGRRQVLVARDRANPKAAADLDPSGERIVSAGYDGRAVVRAVSGEGTPVVMQGQLQGLTDVRFSLDGRHVLTAAGDGTARIWNAATGRAERTLKGDSDSLNSADGTRIVTAGDDGTVRVWSAHGRDEPVILRGHEGAVTAAAFSPDGTRVVSAGADGTVRVWDADGGDTLVVLYTHRGAALSARFDRTGTAVVSNGEDGVARVARCEVCGSLEQVRRIARTRAGRALDAIERRRLLPDDH